jgi:hypothetical protein
LGGAPHDRAGHTHALGDIVETGNGRFGHNAQINAGAAYTQEMRVVCRNTVADDFYGASVIAGTEGEPQFVPRPPVEALGVITVNMAGTPDWPRRRQRLDPI